MITKNGNLPPNCDNCQMEEQQEIRCSKADFRNVDEQGIHTDMQRLQSPVFNIHIHVPPYKGDSSKIYLPRIQPVIHLHFDELARKLEIYREEQNEETTFRVLQNLLRMTSPKFGDVKFHYEDESPESVIRNSENCIKTPTSSQSHCNDISLNLDANMQEAEDTVTENSEICNGSHNYSTNGNMSPESNINENIINSEEQLRRKLQKDYNLKEAVVVLTDVIKSDYYKNLILASGESDKNESSDSKGTVESTLGEKDACRRNEECILRVKQENESQYLPQSLRLDDGDKRDEIIRRDLEYSLSNTSCAITAGTTDNTSNSISLGDPEKTLTALAEGCNFSEILNRFRIKYNEEYDPVKCFEHKNKDEVFDVLTVRKAQNYELNERIREQPCAEEIARLTDQSGSKGENVSGGVEKPYFEDYLESTQNAGDRSAHMQGANFKFEGITTEDTAFEFRINPRYDSNSGSDDGDTVSEKSSTKKDETSCSEIQINLLSETSHTLLNGTYELPENCVANSRSSILKAALIQEGMGKRDKSRTERRNAPGTDSATSASPKKMKPSKEESENSDANKQKSSGLEEYIPLHASGPTKFAVAPLDRVNPYKTHDARNFKKEMLFGNRVHRFSSPDVLRVYKLKQKALKDNVRK